MNFLAFDGTIFDKMAECEAYENRCKISIDVKNKIFCFEATETNITRIEDPMYADFVVIEGKVDSELIEQFFDSFDCYSTGLNEGTGTYYWDDDEEKWVKICHKKYDLEKETISIRRKIDSYEQIEDEIMNFIENSKINTIEEN